MRAALVIAASLVLAAPAAAQSLDLQQRLQLDLRMNELQAQQEQLRQREVAQHNELIAMEARLRTEQAVANARAQAYSPRLPPATTYQGAPPPQIDTGKLASIPDRALAESNRRVREASKPAR